MGEHVRRRLAAAPQTDDTISSSSDTIIRRPTKRTSNLGYRLQTGMNLQVRTKNEWYVCLESVFVDKSDKRMPNDTHYRYVRDITRLGAIESLLFVQCLIGAGKKRKKISLSQRCSRAEASNFKYKHRISDFRTHSSACECTWMSAS